MYFHASSIGGIEILEPRISNHGIPLIYLSTKRENVLIDTYKGVSGYIYAIEAITDSGFQLQIPDAATSSEPTPVKSCEFIPDAYEAILAAEKEGLITILRYEDSSKAQLEWIERTIREEYKNAVNQPEYRYFIESKFSFQYLEQ